jgi:hypothetical protein
MIFFCRKESLNWKEKPGNKSGIKYNDLKAAYRKIPAKRPEFFMNIFGRPYHHAGIRRVSPA